MLNKLIYVIILIIFIFPSETLALSSPERNKIILQNFKERSIKNIFSNNDFQTWTWKLLIDASKKIDLYWAIRQNIENDRKEIEAKKESIVLRIDSLEKSIEFLDNDIKEKTQEVTKTNLDISKTKKEIEKWKEVISLLNKKIEENKKTILQYLIHIFKKWNYSFSNWEIDNIKSVILNSQDIWSIINELYFKSLLELTWQKLLEKHRDYVKVLYIKKLELEENEEKLVSLRNDLIIEKKSLDDKKKFREELLEKTKWKEEEYKEFIEEKIKIEKSFKIKEINASIKFQNVKNDILKEYWCENVDIFKEKEKLRNLTKECSDINKIINAETILQKNTLWENNPLIWPISPDRWISSYFHDIGYKNVIWDDHDAIDIRAAQWTRIKAPADWYVIYVEYPTSPDYSYIAIKHSDWLVSVYWHLSEIFVQKYDYIRKWQVFAKTWWEYWTKWAWYMTTWPHLHFEIFDNKSYSDPLKYLDTSNLDYQDLPEKNKFKFLIDFKNKFWYAFNDNLWIKSSLKIYWINEMERQKSLLEQYAVSDFKDWNMWVEESLEWNIDPTFVMCIWLAESTLWKYTKTKNNIWNVWNTDSWATRTMQSPREWVKSIVKTLNNKFLWHYTKIKELSRYWNPNWAIYASSESNWHNNIIKCMTIVKQKYVPDDYKFRINK